MTAIVLIMAIVAFFSSSTYQKFWYTKVLKQPIPQRIDKSRNTLPKTAPAPMQEAGNGPVHPAITTSPEAATVSEKPAVTIPVDTIWIETKTIIVGISENGARIISLKMKEFGKSHLAKVHDSGYVDLIGKWTDGGAGLTVNNDSYDAVRFVPQHPIPGNKIVVPKDGHVSVTFIQADTTITGGISKQFIFDGEGYKIGFAVSSNQAFNNSKVTLSWPAGIAESEAQAGMGMTEERVAHYSDGIDVWHFRSGKPSREIPPEGTIKWVGVSSKYFFTALVSDTERLANLKIIAVEDTTLGPINGKKNKMKGINYQMSYQFTAQGTTANFWLYTGPSKYLLLKQDQIQFQKILFPVLGFWKNFFWADKWFPPIAEFVLWLLLILFRLTRDYGVAILLLTVLSRVVTYPLTQSSMKSMNRMKDIQPKVNAIRQKHKSNPKKMNEEVMALYKSEGINPLNPGCLPMFLQMPIFIALFVVLRKAIELRASGTILVPWVHDLSQPESVFSFGNLLPGGIPLYGSSFAIMPVIMAVLTYFQNKMTIKDPNQKMMIYFMPVFMLVLFNNFASGLVLYWTLSSGLGLLQQYYTNKSSQKKTITGTGKTGLTRVEQAGRHASRRR